MMSKTHLTMGMATALVIMHLIATPECFLAIIGGALGGIYPDIDIVDNDSLFDLARIPRETIGYFYRTPPSLYWNHPLKPIVVTRRFPVDLRGGEK